jgi:NAD(P)-dependent dehydrogenase (short-subunit alcohol dehydrogenase family)
MTEATKKNKIAVITGGSQGLGFASAKRLYAEGFKLAILGRNPQKLERAAQHIGSDILALPTDVSDPSAVRQSFKQIHRQLGTPTVLINCAAIFQPFVFEEAADDLFEKTVQNNFMGSIHCMREAIRMMRDAGEGRIVNVSSESVRRPYPMLSVYAACKSALETVSQGLREEYRKDGIQICVFRVGRMLSEGAESVAMSPQEQQRFYQAVMEQGLDTFSGAGMATGTAAHALVNSILTPADAHMDLIELRSS